MNKKPMTQTQSRAHMAALAKLYGAPPPVFTESKSYAPKKRPLSTIPPTIAVWGDIAYRGECEIEWREHAAFVGRVRRTFHATYGALLVHVKNEGLRTDDEARNAKMMGMKAGTPDIIIPAKTPFICEIKRTDSTKSSTTNEQITYLETAQNQGCYVCFALGAEAAWEALEHWLTIK